MMRDSLLELPTLASDRLVLRLLGPEFAVPVAEYFARNRAFAQPWNPLMPETFYTADWQRERLAYDLDEYQAGRMLRFWLFRRADTQFTRVISHVGLNNGTHRMRASAQPKRAEARSPIRQRASARFG